MRISAALLVFCCLEAAQLPDAAQIQRTYRARYASQLQALLLEAIRFPTVSGDADAYAKQKLWLRQVSGN